MGTGRPEPIYVVRGEPTIKILYFKRIFLILLFCSFGARGGIRPVPQMGTGRPEPIYVVRGEPTIKILYFKRIFLILLFCSFGARGGIRTHDLTLMKRPLYH
jgi:hypothetical protein